VYGLRLEVPETLTEGTRGLLEALGLEASKTMRVWPAGGPPAAWDDEGQAEWLLGDEVVLGLATDPSVSHLWLALDEQDGQVLPARALGGDVPTFVSVGEVSEGLHRLEVRAIPGQDMDENLGGFLEFVVRAPQNWTPGVSDRAPVSFFVEPRAPSLEELWEGKMQLEVSGPRGHTVHSKISLMAKGNEETLYAKRLPSLDLPVTTGTWLAAFRDHFIQDSASEGAYDLAYICKVDLDAGPLGRFSLACERAFTPLRWQVKATSGHMSVRLIDDVGSQTSDIRRYSFSSPDRYEELDYDAVTGGLAVDQPGGLYSARSERSEAGIVVAPRRAMRSFGDLRIDPVVGSFPRLRANVEEALALAERWKKARLTGVMLARIFRDAVLCTLSSNLFSVICSDSWAAAESSFHKDGKPGMMKAQIAKHPSQKFVATAIELDARSLSDSSVMLRVQRFAHWIRGARVSTAGEKHPQAAVGRFPDGTSDEGLPWTCEFALRMASDPGGVSGWAGARLDLGVDALLAYPFIARAARFLVLSVARSTGDSSQSMSLYRGWEW